MQAAVDTHLQRLCVQNPNKRVILITFNNEVTVWGDGSSVCQTITGDKLSDYEELMNIGKQIEAKSFKPIQDSAQELSKRVAELQETGGNALFYS